MQGGQTSKPDFSGAVKQGRSLLSPLEKGFGAWVIPRLPRWLETYHLTMMTVVWCFCIVLFSYMAKRDIRWLWLVSASVLGQYVTDHLDGKLGRYRNTGLVRWGYFMDHFLDYFFLCSILMGYAFLLPESQQLWMFFVLVVFGGYMVLAYLATLATGHFRVSAAGLGPTEFRLAIIVINTLLISFGTRKMAGALPYVAAGSLLVLIVVAYRTHRQVWKLDMERRAGED
jgi:phosphatidylglycerophosphate synthase